MPEMADGETERGAASRPAPRISLGLPVYNGENFLAETLDSILAQTFDDFELVISDNASTDGTQAICEDYANRDARIRYIRQPGNQGAAANYDFVFEEATGAYFKWCAHDDLLSDTFLERCADALDATPGAVGAMPDTVEIIDANSDPVATISFDFDPEPTGPIERFSTITKNPNFQCSPFFALFRRDVVGRTGLHGNYLNSDRVFVAEMLLHGRLLAVQGCRFMFRRHDMQFSRLGRPSQHRAFAWLDPQNNRKWVFNTSRYVVAHFDAVNRAGLSGTDRLRAYFVVLRLAWARRRQFAMGAVWPLLWRGERQTRLGHVVYRLFGREAAELPPQQ